MDGTNPDNLDVVLMTLKGRGQNVQVISGLSGRTPSLIPADFGGPRLKNPFYELDMSGPQ